MGLFFDSKPRVTKNEFKKVRNSLSSKGFSHKELDQLHLMLGGSLDESSDREKGIDAKEIDQFVTSLRDPKYRKDHTFSDEQIGHIEETLKSHL